MFSERKKEIFSKCMDLPCSLHCIHKFLSLSFLYFLKYKMKQKNKQILLSSSNRWVKFNSDRSREMLKISLPINGRIRASIHIFPLNSLFFHGVQTLVISGSDNHNSTGSKLSCSSQILLKEIYIWFFYHLTFLISWFLTLLFLPCSKHH
jgi:hypothetical protein